MGTLVGVDIVSTHVPASKFFRAAQNQNSLFRKGPMKEIGIGVALGFGLWFLTRFLAGRF